MHEYILCVKVTCIHASKSGVLVIESRPEADTYCACCHNKRPHVNCHSTLFVLASSGPFPGAKPLGTQARGSIFTQSLY